MKKSVLVALLALSSSLAFAQVDKSLRSDVIFRGQPVKADGETWRYVVGTHATTGKSGGACTATIVSDKLLLSAGHCFGQGLDKAVVFSIKYFDGEKFTERAFTSDQFKIHIHPDYPEKADWFEKDTLHDIALVEFNESILLESSRTADFFVSGTFEGKRVLSVGAGSDESGKLSSILSFTAGSVVYTNNTAIVIESEKGTGVCAGDSGGPLLGKGADGRYFVLGVAMSVVPDLSDKCGNTVIYTKFLNEQNLKWLQSVITTKP